jgi:hypothetical protein
MSSEALPLDPAALLEVLEQTKQAVVELENREECHLARIVELEAAHSKQASAAHDSFRRELQGMLEALAVPLGLDTPAKIAASVDLAVTKPGALTKLASDILRATALASIEGSAVSSSSVTVPAPRRDRSFQLFVGDSGS